MRNRFLEVFLLMLAGTLALAISMAPATHAKGKPEGKGKTEVEVAITRPRDGAILDNGTQIPIYFEGTASYGEQKLTAELLWESDIQGTLYPEPESGYPEEYPGFFSTTLTAFESQEYTEHTITASVTYDGKTGSDSIVVYVRRVWPDPTLEVDVSLHWGYDQPVWPEVYPGPRRPIIMARWRR